MFTPQFFVCPLEGNKVKCKLITTRPDFYYTAFPKQAANKVNISKQVENKVKCKLTISEPDVHYTNFPKQVE